MDAPIVPLREAGALPVGAVGGKAGPLGRLAAAQMPVPAGFVICTHAFDAPHDGAALLTVPRDAPPAALAAASRRLRARLAQRALPRPAHGQVLDAFRGLLDTGVSAVAVRSSAVDEDGAHSSFAGQHETILGVTDERRLLAAVTRCWTSLFTPWAIRYRMDAARAAGPPRMAVIVQAMVEAEASGVLFTADPVTGDDAEVRIESVHGLGVGLVNGSMQPDVTRIEKWTLRTIETRSRRKTTAYRWCAGAGAVVRTRVAPEDRMRPALRPDEAIALVRVARRVERLLGVTQDIEWAVSSTHGERRLSILQARPACGGRVRPAPAPAGGPAGDVSDAAHVVRALVGTRRG